MDSKSQAATRSTSASATEATASPAAHSDKTDGAHGIVRRNVFWALGVGLVPLPIVDFLGVTAVQVKMLRELSAHYDVKFSEQIAKKVIASLVAGLGSAGLGVAISSTLFKFIPIVGTSLGVVSMPVIAGAFTMATGRVFVAHFESGGTVLTFNAKAIREHFRAEFERAKPIVSQMKQDEPAKAPTAATAAPVSP